MGKAANTVAPPLPMLPGSSPREHPPPTPRSGLHCLHCTDICQLIPSVPSVLHALRAQLPIPPLLFLLYSLFCCSAATNDRLVMFVTSNDYFNLLIHCYMAPVTDAITHSSPSFSMSASTYTHLLYRVICLLLFLWGVLPMPSTSLFLSPFDEVSYQEIR